MSTFYDRFFKQVKNKPIRWSSWDKYEFFIPKELGYDNWMYGITA